MKRTLPLIAALALTLSACGSSSPSTDETTSATSASSSASSSTAAEQTSTPEALTGEAAASAIVDYFQLQDTCPTAADLNVATGRTDIPEATSAKPAVDAQTRLCQYGIDLSAGSQPGPVTILIMAATDPAAALTAEQAEVQMGTPTTPAPEYGPNSFFLSENSSCMLVVNDPDSYGISLGTNLQNPTGGDVCADVRAIADMALN